jgi:hypothetical protein
MPNSRFKIQDPSFQRSLLMEHYSIGVNLSCGSRDEARVSGVILWPTAQAVGEKRWTLH